jgi:hypothetical protein
MTSGHPDGRSTQSAPAVNAHAAAKAASASAPAPINAALRRRAAVAASHA